MAGTIAIKNLKLTSNMMKSKIFSNNYDILYNIERSWKTLLFGKNFKNSDWNYYDRKAEINPGTRYVNQKT